MNWEEYFYEICEVVSKKSKDTSYKTGCVIAGKNHETLSTGFNGFPIGVEDNIIKVSERYERPEKYLWTEHGERNAIYFAARNGIALEGSWIYVKGHPCAECTRAIIQSGIKKIVVQAEGAYDLSTKGQSDRQKKWTEEFRVSDLMIKESGIELEMYGTIKVKCKCKPHDKIYYGCQCGAEIVDYTFKGARRP